MQKLLSTRWQLFFLFILWQYTLGISSLGGFLGQWGIRIMLSPPPEGWAGEFTCSQHLRQALHPAPLLQPLPCPPSGPKPLPCPWTTLLLECSMTAPASHGSLSSNLPLKASVPCLLFLQRPWHTYSPVLALHVLSVVLSLP